MFCSSCGKELTQSQRFCPFCGVVAESISAVDNRIDFTGGVVALNILGMLAIAWATYPIRTEMESPSAIIFLLIRIGVPVLIAAIIVGAFVFFRGNREKNRIKRSIIITSWLLLGLVIFGDMNRTAAITTETTPGIPQYTDNTGKEQVLLSSSTNLPQNDIEQRLASTAPQNIRECLDRYATAASAMANLEITSGFCETAFDPAAHPVDRARSLCQVQGWTESPTIKPSVISEICDSENPLPSCPAGQRFELHNKRCEVRCYGPGLETYAPDSSGQKCVKVCPDGTRAAYYGFTTQCDVR